MSLPIKSRFTPFEETKLTELSQAVAENSMVHIDSATARVIAKFFEERKENESIGPTYANLSEMSIQKLILQDSKNWSLGTKVLSAIKNFFLSLGNNLMLSKEKQPWFVSSPHWAF